MSDDGKSDTERNRECPERGCTIAMRPGEIRAHLDWDHNRRDREIERMMNDG